MCCGECVGGRVGRENWRGWQRETCSAYQWCPGARTNSSLTYSKHVEIRGRVPVKGPLWCLSWTSFSWLNKEALSLFVVCQKREIIYSNVKKERTEREKKLFHTIGKWMDEHICVRFKSWTQHTFCGGKSQWVWSYNACLWKYLFIYSDIGVKCEHSFV